MKKSFFYLTLVLSVFMLIPSCKEEKPKPVDPNLVLQRNIVRYQNYITKEPQTEYDFTFMLDSGEMMTDVMLGTYSAVLKGQTEIKHSGTWDVKNQRIFLYKEKGAEFDKINGGEILNKGQVLDVKTGSTVLRLYALEEEK